MFYNSFDFLQVAMEELDFKEVSVKIRNTFYDRNL